MEQPPIWSHEVTRRSGHVVIALAGELDLACTAALQALLFEHIESGQVTDLHIDLADVGFLDSSALGMLISGLNHAQEQGCRFAVINPSPMARRVLAITGLDDVLLQP